MFDYALQSNLSGISSFVVLGVIMECLIYPRASMKHAARIMSLNYSYMRNTTLDYQRQEFRLLQESVQILPATHLFKRSSGEVVINAIVAYFDEVLPIYGVKSESDVRILAALEDTEMFRIFERWRLLSQDITATKEKVEEELAKCTFEVIDESLRKAARVPGVDVGRNQKTSQGVSFSHFPSTGLAKVKRRLPTLQMLHRRVLLA